jgi:3-oxoadipate enol-lactonase
MPYTKDAVRIYYETYGEGPTIVLVHANPFDHRLWMYQIARWSSFYRVIAVDIRGYGRSDKPETPFSLADMAEDVLGVCRQEQVTRAIFGGVSVGSGISLLIGLDHPELAQALILVGGSSVGNAGMQKRIDGFTSADLPAYQRTHLADCTAPGFPETPRGRWLLGMFNDRADTLSGKSIARIFEARMQCDMRPRLGGLRVPALVVNGEHDGSMKGGRETASLAAGAEHAVIKGAGHCCNIEEPASFDAAVIPFLAKHRLWRGPASDSAA